VGAGSPRSDAVRRAAFAVAAVALASIALAARADAYVYWTHLDTESIGRGSGGDTVSGGPGNDTVSAGPGGDTVNARDGNADRVDCGPGTDTATLDPKDAITGASGQNPSGSCESVVRKAGAGARHRRAQTR
jgi:Ca2+-binding RTX toxin-like protein